MQLSALPLGLLLAAVGFVDAQTSASAAPTTTPVPDKPILFWAQLYNDVADCSGGKTYAYLGSQGSCVNRTINGNGSAIITIGEESVYYLAGWTGPDCTGQVVLVQSIVGECQSLDGVVDEVLSWSNDDRPFGKQ